MLASAARLVLGQLGLDTPVTTPESATDELIDLVTAELGSDWPRLVAPAFDGRRPSCSTTAGPAPARTWSSWLMDEGDIDADWPRLERFEGAGHVVATQANWWQGGPAAGRNVHASLFGRAAAGAENPGQGRYSDEIAVVTGASKGSIAASVVASCSTAAPRSSPRRRGSMTIGWRSTSFYRDNARFGATLWVVPANMASYSDIDALVAWVGTEQTESLGPQSIHLKDAQTPTLLSVRGAGGGRSVRRRATLGDGDEGAAVGRAAAHRRPVDIGAERDIASRLHVVLPGSPNRGMFGGDGAYGESKSALDAVVSRWNAESSWAQRVSLARADRLDQGHRTDGPQRAPSSARSKRPA